MNALKVVSNIIIGFIFLLVFFVVLVVYVSVMVYLTKGTFVESFAWAVPPLIIGIAFCLYHIGKYLRSLIGR